MQREFDLVIAGAGLVGAALALGAARTGLRIGVVERMPAPRGLAEDPRGLALNHRSVAVLETLGVWPSLAAHACPIHDIVVTQRGHFGSLVLSRDDLGMPALGHVCPADRLQQALLERLVTTPGISLCWETSLETSRVDGARRQITVRREGHTEEWHTALLIGADGTESTVRTLAGIDAARADFAQVALVCNLYVAQPQPFTAFERFTSAGPQALLPLGGRRYVMVRCARADEAAALQRLSDTDYLADAQRRFGYRMGSFSRPGPRRPWPLQRLRASSLMGARILLMGNAATTVHPNAAQGLNLGLRDVAAALAWLEDLQAQGGDPGAAANLESLAARRLPDHQAIARLTDGLATAFASPLPGAAPVLALGLAGLQACAPLRRAMLNRLVAGHTT